jgi:hypothetical protein
VSFQHGRKVFLPGTTDFVDNAGMDVRLRIERILRRVQLSAVELELQPEAFQATEELRLASGELASLLEELDSSNQKCTGLSGFSWRVVPHGHPRVTATAISDRRTKSFGGGVEHEALHLLWQSG